MTITDPMPYEPRPPESSYATQLKIAGILLIVFAALAVLGNIYFIASVSFQLAVGQAHPPPNHQPGFQTGFYVGFYAPLVLGIIALPLLALIIIGAISMLTRRRYKMAYIASILAMIPFSASCCCILTLPFGIWSFILLSKEEVKNLFS